MYPVDYGEENWAIICHQCRLYKHPHDVSFDTPKAALKHLREHIIFGHLVTMAALIRLKAEVGE